MTIIFSSFLTTPCEVSAFFLTFWVSESTSGSAEFTPHCGALQVYTVNRWRQVTRDSCLYKRNRFGSNKIFESREMLTNLSSALFQLHFFFSKKVNDSSQIIDCTFHIRIIFINFHKIFASRQNEYAVFCYSPFHAKNLRHQHSINVYALFITAHYSFSQMNSLWKIFLIRSIGQFQ